MLTASGCRKLQSSFSVPISGPIIQLKARELASLLGFVSGSGTNRLNHACRQTKTNLIHVELARFN